MAVVFLHTNNTLSNNSTQFSLTEEQVIFFTTNNLLMNWAVPVFLMISGTLLLDPSRQITFRICVNKYVKRILLALFIFGVPFSILEIVLNVKTINAEIVLEAIINVINGNSWSHLWYLYSLIGLYLIDRLCFGVYLIHPVFINFMYKFLKFTPAKFEGIYPVATFVFWMFFVSASFIGSWIMYQVPVLKKYVL